MGSEPLARCTGHAGFASEPKLFKIDTKKAPTTAISSFGHVSVQKWPINPRMSQFVCCLAQFNLENRPLRKGKKRLARGLERSRKADQAERKHRVTAGVTERFW